MCLHRELPKMYLYTTSTQSVHTLCHHVKCSQWRLICHDYLEEEEKLLRLDLCFLFGVSILMRKMCLRREVLKMFLSQ